MLNELSSDWSPSFRPDTMPCRWTTRPSQPATIALAAWNLWFWNDMPAFLFWSVGSSDTAFAGGTRFDLFVSVCDIIHGGSVCRVRDRILQSCDLANHFLSHLPWENAAYKCSFKRESQPHIFTGKSLPKGWNSLAPHRPRASSWDLGLRAAGKAWVVVGWSGSSAAPEASRWLKIRNYYR